MEIQLLSSARLGREDLAGPVVIQCLTAEGRPFALQAGDQFALFMRCENLLIEGIPAIQDADRGVIQYGWQPGQTRFGGTFQLQVQVDRDGLVESSASSAGPTLTIAPLVIDGDVVRVEAGPTRRLMWISGNPVDGWGVAYDAISDSFASTEVAAGSPGPPGPPGPVGAKGETGSSAGDLSLIVEFSMQTELIIEHGFPRRPEVAVTDSQGVTHRPGIEFLNQSTIKLTFAIPISGTATLT